MTQIKTVLIAFLGLALLPHLAACGVPSALDRPERASAYFIRDVAVLDPDEDTLHPPQDVLVIGGLIEAVGDLASLSMPVDAHVIDGTGLVLMPGLIDMHVHIFDEADLAANLVYGVTTVRNLAGMPFHLPMAQRIADGRLAGPRLITTGPILNERGGRNTNPLQTLISGPDEARQAVRRQYRQGYRHLKLYSNVSRESFAAILDEARQLDMTVSGHPVEGTEADPMPIGDTLAAGFLTIEHAESIIWHALNDDTDPERMRALAADIARASATVTPTLIVHANLARIVETRGTHLERGDMAGFNPVILDSQRGEYEYWASRETSDRPRMQTAYEIFTGMLHAAGVPLLLGSDAGVMATPHGVSAIEELEALVRAGLTPDAALRAGTVNAAAILTPKVSTGRIAPGFAADLVLLGADPREDFQVLRQPLAVMANGYWYDTDALEALRNASRRPGVWRTRLRFLVHVLAR